MYPQKTDTLSACYRQFREIDPQAYHTIIRFFEEHAFIIKSLDFEEYFEIMTAYVRALFEAGAYQKHAEMADVIIEAAIINNLKVYRGDDIYEKTLFQKAASLYHLQHFTKSDHILSELIKMNPSENTYRLFLIKNRLHVKPAYLHVLQGLSIFLYFLSIIIISIQTFYIDPFRPEWTGLAFSARNATFISASVLLILSDLVFRGATWYGVHTLASEAREKLKRS